MFVILSPAPVQRQSMSSLGVNSREKERRMARIIADSWVAAESKNVPQAARFYQKLGLKPTRRMGRNYVEFKVPGGTVLGLYSIGRKRVPKPTGGWGIMLRVKNIEKRIAELKRKGIRCRRIESPGGGSKMSWFADPDGNRCVLLQFGK
jgi:predicted enzyme related to lactoylglutathione lyase